MPWNWELPEWPFFTFESSLLATKEKEFLLGVGSSGAFLKNIQRNDYEGFVVEILCQEGIESSRIEGEFLDRESLQSSIQKHFGLKSKKNQRLREEGMAEPLWSVYQSYNDPLTHEMLFQWHISLFKGSMDIEVVGQYRTHADPMQIISNRYGDRRVYFEAPPSKQIPFEMNRFINWYNDSSETSLLAKAAVAHMYFESIHPFEDGNGRIGRLLIEKILSQGVDRPVLIAVSKVLEKRKKEYYAALERCNKTLEINHWLNFFGEVVLQAQQESMKLLSFLVGKAQVMTRLQGQLNERQEKVLLRMFQEGPDGFKGGLSAENYLAISPTSRATATRDLTDLVDKGALRRTGELRHTRYWLITE